MHTEPPTQTATHPVTQIGNRLRHLRLQRSMSLRTLAGMLGISASALSQLETGRRSPSLERLHQIVAALDYPLNAVFDDDSGRDENPHAGEEERFPGQTSEDLAGVIIQRALQAPAVILAGNIEWTAAAPMQVSGLDLLRVTYPAGAQPAEPVTHTGVEIVHVVQGTLRFEVGDERSELSNGDSIMYNAKTPHRISNPTKEPASAIWTVIEGTCQLRPAQHPPNHGEVG
ncbi:helix-turn-helix transcriptional regulator (plasmid) [Paenarthrobacter ureafaciens]|nr:helix-turn-helix transcriptional regulator [Paenarthrobacter ureafaciens]